MPIDFLEAPWKLSEGEHAGFRWAVAWVDCGHRCGYAGVPPGHPWHGIHRDEVPARAHGGITFAEEGDGLWWVGFDCGHAGDLPDPELPVSPEMEWHCRALERAAALDSREWRVWTQRAVEAECRSLCEQAAVAARARRC